MLSLFASVAQWIEQERPKLCVGGSILSWGNPNAPIERVFFDELIVKKSTYDGHFTYTCTW